MQAETPIHLRYPSLTKEEHQAIRALNGGEANEYQQKLCLSIIVKKFSATHQQPYISGNSGDTSFMCGRGYVGSRILKYINLPVTDGEKENV